MYIDDHGIDKAIPSKRDRASEWLKEAKIKQWQDSKNNR